MLNRRELMVVTAALPLAAAVPKKMTLCMHQTTSAAAGYRKSLEGYSKAGFTEVELIAAHVDPFLKSDGLGAAKRLLSDLGLTAVSYGGMRGLWEPSTERPKTLDQLRHNSEVAASLGIDRMVAPCTATGKFTMDDYKTVLANMHEAGEIARPYNLTLMVEFTRASTLIGTLPTSLRLVREAAHPNVRQMFDFYHYWSGLSKFEDMPMIRPDEIHHVHFQDVPDIPRELLNNTTREIPGTGVTPIPKILDALRARGYAGPLSVELFDPKYQNGDPYEVARMVREKAGKFV